ncbi:glycosyl hydrolase family 38 protein [Cooperia oncophora]
MKKLNERQHVEENTHSNCWRRSIQSRGRSRSRRESRSRKNKVAIVFDELHRSVKPTEYVCQLRGNYSNSHADVQMLDLYDVLPFDNPDGGVWKQGWDVTYDQEKVAEQKTLQVIVLPHSHCDPGWIKTFEEYYTSQTKNILDNMVNHLGENQKDMRFIYAEISFFELWWKEQSDDVRNKVIQLLKDGQLELVTGGWVMTDEANAHYFSIITELIEGHEWIRNHIGRDFTPTSHWSIDPFGLSPSIPYLMSAANITNAAIQRCSLYSFIVSKTRPR